VSTESTSAVPSQRSAGLWARQTTKDVPRATSRSRQMVEGLPAWEPLPPGEMLVRRPQP
jgi:hypothetical protein